MKTCTKCGKEYPATAEFFTKNRCRKDGLHCWCKICGREYANIRTREHRQERREYSKRWYEKHKNELRIKARVISQIPEIKLQHRKNKLKREYGLTLDQYDKMFVVQNGVCAICGKSGIIKNQWDTMRLAVDHDHQTGRVRGLLCNRCNLGVGYVEDGVFAANAKAYLEKYKC